jgi:hypothetical protein
VREDYASFKLLQAEVKDEEHEMRRYSYKVEFFPIEEVKIEEQLDKERIEAIMDIKINLPRIDNKSGDLGNFIKGICDGLSVIKSIDNPNYEIHQDFKRFEHKNIHPETFAMIKDDGEIVKITATKSFEDIKEPFYEIILEGK